MSRLAASVVIVVLVVTTAGCGGLVDGETTSSPDVTDRPVTEATANTTDAEEDDGPFQPPRDDAESPDERTPTDDPSPEEPPSEESSNEATEGNPTEDPSTEDRSTEETPTEGTTTDEPVERGDRATRNADDRLPVDVFETYDRTAATMDADVPIPTTAVETFEGDSPAYRGPFYERLNRTERGERADDEAAGDATPDRVTIVLPPEPDPDTVEQVLVHEYVHSIQFRTGMLPFDPGVDDPGDTSEYYTLRRALVEGAAVWATDEDAHRYRTDAAPQSELARERYLEGPPATRDQWAPYSLGAAYVDGRIDDPAATERVFDDPPRTTEQLLHELEPGAEPPTDLDVSVEDGTRGWRAVDDDRMGELFVRVVLGTELAEPIAAGGATGWGNDALLEFGDDRGRTSFVWTIHWDDASAADGFEAAFESYLAGRTDDHADDTRLLRISAETVAVVIGPDDFHDAVSIDGTGTDVTVTTAAGSSAANVAPASTTTARPVV